MDPPNREGFYAFRTSPEGVEWAGVRVDQVQHHREYGGEETAPRLDEASGPGGGKSFRGVEKMLFVNRKQASEILRHSKRTLGCQSLGDYRAERGNGF